MTARHWILFVACQLAGFSAAHASYRLLYSPLGLAGVIPSWAISMLLLAPGHLLVLLLNNGPFSLVRYWITIAACVSLNAGTWWLVAWLWRRHKARNRSALQA